MLAKLIGQHAFALGTAARYPQETMVRTTTLDEQLHENAGPDLIKIDVEGADLEVLEGGRHMLERNLPIVFYEATAGNFNQTRGLPEELWVQII